MVCSFFFGLQMQMQPPQKEKEIEIDNLVLATFPQFQETNIQFLQDVWCKDDQSWIESVHQNIHELVVTATPSLTKKEQKEKVMSQVMGLTAFLDDPDRYMGFRISGMANHLITLPLTKMVVLMGAARTPKALDLETQVTKKLKIPMEMLVSSPPPPQKEKDCFLLMIRGDTDRKLVGVQGIIQKLQPEYMCVVTDTSQENEFLKWLCRDKQGPACYQVLNFAIYKHLQVDFSDPTMSEKKSHALFLILQKTIGFPTVETKKKRLQTTTTSMISWRQPFVEMIETLCFENVLGLADLVMDYYPLEIKIDFHDQYDLLFWIHDHCPDGNFVRHLLKKFQGQANTFGYTHHVTKIDANSIKEKSLVFIDVTPPNLLELSQTAKSILVIDHHHPSLEEALGMDAQRLPSNVTLVFSPLEPRDVSASMLVWKHVICPSLEEREKEQFAFYERVVEVVSMADTGKLLQGEESAVNQIIRFMTATPGPQKQTLEELFKSSDYDWNQLVGMGMPLVTNKIKELTDLCKQCPLAVILKTQCELVLPNINKKLAFWFNLTHWSRVLFNPAPPISHRVKESQEEKVRYKCRMMLLPPNKYLAVTELSQFLAEEKENYFDVFIGVFHELIGVFDEFRKVNGPPKKITKFSCRRHPKKAHVDVSILAKHFGGGGHAGAAAFQMDGHLALDKIIF